ncbi:hypothetical protein [Bradyrhizobium symbiodeficiens]|uniref:hypothetical protein n=1 Tax=Bradyrhizobium symbiodeficiens TaxID=1404367 RepID=UPI00140FDDF7|nr:hypothetical protein [Bradyrhizobium symbiodeficiens]QIP01758.1 hypothetical protein HAU86_19045 [Bradyrhizobium symbiodeficiens]
MPRRRHALDMQRHEVADLAWIYLYSAWRRMIRRAGSYSLGTSNRGRGSRAHRILGIASARLISVLGSSGETRATWAGLELGFAPGWLISVEYDRIFLFLRISAGSTVFGYAIFVH